MDCAGRLLRPSQGGKKGAIVVFFSRKLEFKSVTSNMLACAITMPKSAKASRSAQLGFLVGLVCWLEGSQGNSESLYCKCGLHASLFGRSARRLSSSQIFHSLYRTIDLALEISDGASPQPVEKEFFIVEELSVK